MQVFFISLFFVFSIPTFAQEEDTMKVSVFLKDLNALKTERDNAVKLCDSFKKVNQEIYKRDSVNSIRINSLEQENDSLDTLLTKLHVDYEKSNKKLANIVSNFLYIAYEAYSVDNIAIPAFEAITIPSLREKNEIKYNLLKCYKQDIQSFLNFIKEVKAEYKNNPFASKSSDVKNAFIQKLHHQVFYKNYVKYDRWRETYLGKRIVKVENELKNSSGSKKPNFDSIESELNNCLKSEEEL